MSNWKIKLGIRSKDLDSTKSLCDALVTDCEIEWDADSFSIEILEDKAKDLRAMWNTRIRGLIAVDSLINVIDQY
tara:strand:- start:2948 stop:3172 length:225 start_codon:yes stop_codon:yes gene_type:complete